jgi:glycosyltransferase involved in cell wall biosynthesis
MKILQVIPYFVPAYGYGGPVKNCYYLSKKLKEIGHEVTVATTDALDEKKRIKRLQENIDGIKTIRFKNLSNYLAKNYNGFFPIGFNEWVRNNIQNYDIVHCHDFFTYQNFIIAKNCNKYKIPFIIQPRGVLSQIRMQARFSFLKKKIISIFEKQVKDYATIVATSEVEKREIKTTFPKIKNKIPVIYNGVNLNEFENVSKFDIYDKYKIPKNNKVIAFIGRIQYIKGIDVSLEVLSLLKDKIDFKFLIIGPEEQHEKEKLIKRAKNLGLENKLIFTGILTGEEKLRTMKSCDIFLFTSRAEGTPITAIEVAALGIPQIISEGCPISEIINKEKGGFRFQLNQKKEMAKKIIEILENNKLYNKIGKSAKLLVKQKLNLNIVIQEFKNLYLKLI